MTDDEMKDLKEKVINALVAKGKPIAYNAEGVASILAATTEAMKEYEVSKPAPKIKLVGSGYNVGKVYTEITKEHIHNHDDLMDTKLLWFNTVLGPTHDPMPVGSQYDPNQTMMGVQYKLQCMNCHGLYIASYDYPTCCPLCGTAKEQSVVMEKLAGPSVPSWNVSGPSPFDMSAFTDVPKGMEKYLPVSLVFRMSEGGYFEGLSGDMHEVIWSPNAVRIFKGPLGLLDAQHHCKVYGAFIVNPFEPNCQVIIDWQHWLLCQPSGDPWIQSNAFFLIKD